MAGLCREHIRMYITIRPSHYRPEININTDSVHVYIKDLNFKASKNRIKEICPNGLLPIP